MNEALGKLKERLQFRDSDVFPENAGALGPTVSAVDLQSDFSGGAHYRFRLLLIEGRMRGRRGIESANLEIVDPDLDDWEFGFPGAAYLHLIPFRRFPAGEPFFSGAGFFVDTVRPIPGPGIGLCFQCGLIFLNAREREGSKRGTVGFRLKSDMADVSGVVIIHVDLPTFPFVIGAEKDPAAGTPVGLHGNIQFKLAVGLLCEEQASFARSGGILFAEK